MPVYPLLALVNQSLHNCPAIVVALLQRSHRCLHRRIGQQDRLATQSGDGLIQNHEECFRLVTCKRCVFGLCHLNPGDKKREQLVDPST